MALLRTRLLRKSSILVGFGKSNECGTIMMNRTTFTQTRCFSSVPSRFRADNYFSSTFHFSLREPTDSNEQGFTFDDHLIILNTPYFSEVFPKELFNDLWQSCHWKYCADGGANRLHKFIQGSLLSSETKYIPDAICGDLDSLQQDVAEYYQKRGTRIVKVDEQDSNDLQKCVRMLKEQIVTENRQQSQNMLHRVFIIGGGGRLDQEMCDLNTLMIEALIEFGEKQDITTNRSTGTDYPILHNRLQFIMVTPFSVIHVLMPGKHNIIRNERWEKSTCALVPLGQPCENVITKGLEWNLNGHKLEFGGLVSTSNRMLEKNIVIENSHPLLWITSLNSGLDK